MIYCPFTKRKLVQNPKDMNEYRSDKGLIYNCKEHTAKFAVNAPQYMQESVKALQVIMNNTFVFAFANTKLFTPAFRLDSLRLSGYINKSEDNPYAEDCLEMSRILFDTPTDDVHLVAYKKTVNLCITECLTYEFTNNSKNFDFPDITKFESVEKYLGYLIEVFTSVRTREFSFNELLFLRYLCCPSLDHFLIHLGDILVSDEVILYTHMLLCDFDYKRIRAAEASFVLYNYLHVLNSNCCNFIDEPTTLYEAMLALGRLGNSAYNVNVQKSVAQAFPALYAANMSFQYYALNPLNKNYYHPDYFEDLKTGKYVNQNAFRDQLPIYKYLSGLYENIDSNTDFQGNDEDDYMQYMIAKCEKFKEFTRNATG